MSVLLLRDVIINIFFSEVKQPEDICPDTGQRDEVSSFSSPTEEGSNAEPSSTLPSQTPPKVNLFQGVRPAKFVPGVNVLGGNPFAARPPLKADVVSTDSPSQSVGPSNQAKFVLRPSALSSQPHNRAEDNLGLSSSAISSILKPAKLPDPFRSVSHEEQEVTEKENKEASPVKEKVKTLPDSGGGGNGDGPASVLKEEETKDSQEKEDRKQPDSSSSPRSSSSNHNNHDDKDNILGQNLTEKVTGVHTSPKGLVSSSGFVFGENLADRVVQRSISEENVEDGNASPDSTEQTNAEAGKTLEESAREYQATHGKKTELQEVEIVTGEEDESNVLQVNGKLFVFDGDHQNWLERGRGIFRLNDMRCTSSASFQSRLLMRTQGSLRLILNTKVWPGMTVMRASQKSVRLTATDGDDGVKVFLLITNPKDNENILRALDWRIQQLRVQDDHKEVINVAEKRKAEPESPTEDFTPKKAKKSPDEGFASFKREESDSSVIDPETEASSESHASSFTLRTDSD